MTHEFRVRRDCENAQLEGSPSVIFPDDQLVVSGEDMYVHRKILGWKSCFYLALPPNVFGVVTSPDGTNKNLAGGLYEARPGLYKVQYVDKKEREVISEQGGNITKSKEKIKLTLLVRYRVIDPIALLQISNPVTTLVNHINAGISRYIGTREISQIADNPEDPLRVLSFFRERLGHHHLLSKAFMLTGVEIKGFDGDSEILEVLRNTEMAKRFRKLEEEQQELKRQRDDYQIENENREIDHKQEMKEKEKKIKTLEIELQDRGDKSRVEQEKYTSALNAISIALSSGPLDASKMDVIKELLVELNGHVEKSNVVSENLSSDEENVQAADDADETPVPPSPAPTPRTPENDKVTELTNTLLNLMGPKK